VYRQFFSALAEILPCYLCRQSTRVYLRSASTRLNARIFRSKQTLTRWLVRLHNRVNTKLKHRRIAYTDVASRMCQLRVVRGKKGKWKKDHRCFSQKARN
jgi:hypothetical protein